MDIDDTRTDLIEHVEAWGVVAGQAWVRMDDGSESWIDARSHLAEQLYALPDLGEWGARARERVLGAVRAAIAAREAADARLDDAVSAALAEPGVTQEQVAALLGITARGLRKRLAS